MESRQGSRGTLRLVVRVCVTAVSVAVLVAMAPAWLAIMRADPARPRDFVQDWASARNVLDGRPVYEDQRRTLPDYLGIDTRGGLNVIYNAHPPTSVVVTLPFAPLDYASAAWWWNSVSFALLAVSLALLARGVGWHPSIWAIAPSLALLAVWVPLWLHTLQGQLGLLLLALFTGAWWAGRNNRWGWCGALLGTAATIKVFPIVLFGLLVALRRWRGVVTGVATAALITIATALLVGPQPFVDYAVIVAPNLNRWRPDWINSSLTGFFAHLFAPDDTIRPLLASQLLATALTIASSLVVIAVVVLLARRIGTVDFDGVYALGLTGLLLISPLTWSHYFVVLLVPFVIWTRRLWLAGRVATGRWVALTVTWLLMALPQLDIARALIDGGVADPIHSVTVLALNFYGLIGFFVAQAWWLLADTEPTRVELPLTQRAELAADMAVAGDRRS